ncbi:hypothetical protein ACFQ9V_17815 [Leifsonia sp. NPDC056665]|uniref:hypothetical protein n=1 Tax=Leifsonia sp. NPDC056665 TaxID=3345901 RepID=UPI0036CD7A0F
MAVVALVALATTPGPALSTVRLVDALVVLIAAALCAFCAGVAEVRRARERDADGAMLSAERSNAVR